MPQNRLSRTIVAGFLSFILYGLPPFIRGKPTVIANLLDLAGLDAWGAEFRYEVLIDVPGGFWALVPIAATLIVLSCQVGYFLCIRPLLRWDRLLPRSFAVLLTGFGFLALVEVGEAFALPAGFRVVEPLLSFRTGKRSELDFCACRAASLAKLHFGKATFSFPGSTRPSTAERSS